MNELVNIIDNLEGQKIGKSVYYKLKDLYDILSDYKNITIEKDISLVPFYIVTNGTFEIYEYELYVRNILTSKREEYYLESTGKSKVNDIDAEILERLDLCYIEVKNHNCETAELCKYLTYLMKEENLIERIPKSMGKFDSDNLYFEVYAFD